MRKIFFTLTLITIPILSIFASGEKETNLGGQIDVYAEYSPIEEVTISLGEEVSFTNFLATEDGVFDATNTVLGVTYTPHPNIAIEAGYEFLYSNAEVMEHCVKLSAIPQVELGDFSLSLQETAQMTYSMFEKSYNWQIVSNLEVAYAIPNTPLSAYIYTEMTNPLSTITEPVAVTEPLAVTELVDVLLTDREKVPAKEQNTPWYDEFCHGVGLDWSIDEINTLGIYYEFSHTVDSYSHLIGIGYTASF
jgi:hypothetical protein